MAATMRGTVFIFCLLLAIAQGRHRRTEHQQRERKGKFFGLFNIVTFPNDVCNGTNDMQGNFPFTSVQPLLNVFRSLFFKSLPGLLKVLSFSALKLLKV